MKDSYRIEVCGKVNAHEFVDSCAHDDLRRYTPKQKRDLIEKYTHIIQCKDCLHRVGCAFEEYCAGNDEFPLERFHEITTYLHRKYEHLKKETDKNLR